MATETTDGFRIRITAKTDSRGQLDQALVSGADGIGLLGAEPFGPGLTPPDQEEYNYALFIDAARAVEGETVTVRLTDPQTGLPEKGDCGRGDAESPGPGGVRLCLERPDLYRPQLRALLRAGAYSRYELALPMVGHVSEITGFKDLLGQIRADLEDQGQPCSPPAVGIMVQVPAVIPTMETLIYESGFFILDGDYLKYLMADHRLPRGEEDFLSFYNHAFLLQAQTLSQFLLKRRAGARISAPLVIDPAAVLLLVGLSFNEIVAPPGRIPEIKKIVSSINYNAARLVSFKTMSYIFPEQAREYARERLLKLLQKTR